MNGELNARTDELQNLAPSLSVLTSYLKLFYTFDSIIDLLSGHSILSLDPRKGSDKRGDA
ncbi:hypothetical protein SAE01_07630 [Segetibacter aerophilus]|uniref:Uncharacterized protein n=1 Tax=Segetibacter aerophilus TaxID=670293 RepID=A0A512B8X0_9BACT|nr:hypothetical protein SAE01_07630 [Segetibacter aerophilus]